MTSLGPNELIHCSLIYDWHWGLNKMAIIMQTTFSNAFSQMQIIGFWFKFHRYFLPMVQLTITHHYVGWWLGVKQVTSHFLDQQWSSSAGAYGVTRPQCVKAKGVCFLDTLRCHYNVVNFLTNIEKRHSIAHPLGQIMRCLLWAQPLIDIMPEFRHLFMPYMYLTILVHIITALNYIWKLDN